MMAVQTGLFNPWQFAGLGEGNAAKDSILFERLMRRRKQIA